MKSTETAYILCCAGFFGVAGVHRFYLGKYGTGVLYLFTFGLFGIGSIIDLFRIPRMVEEENRKIQGQTGQQVAIDPQPFHAQVQQPQQIPQESQASKKDPEKKLEDTILRLARKFQGNLTPLELAANSSLSLDEADKALENFVRKGYANMKVTDEGTIIYEFPGFLQFDSSNSRELSGE